MSFTKYDDADSEPDAEGPNTNDDVQETKDKKDRPAEDKEDARELWEKSEREKEEDGRRREHRFDNDLIDVEKETHRKIEAAIDRKNDKLADKTGYQNAMFSTSQRSGPEGGPGNDDPEDKERDRLAAEEYLEHEMRDYTREGTQKEQMLVEALRFEREEGRLPVRQTMEHERDAEERVQNAEHKRREQEEGRQWRESELASAEDPGHKQQTGGAEQRDHDNFARGKKRNSEDRDRGESDESI